MRPFLLAALLAAALAGCLDDEGTQPETPVDTDGDGIPDATDPDPANPANLPQTIDVTEQVMVGADPWNNVPNVPDDPMGNRPPCSMPEPASTCASYEFTIAAGKVDVAITLDWEQDANDFDLYVYDADGELVSDPAINSFAVGAPVADVQTSIDNLKAGTYRIEVVAWAVVADAYHLVATFSA